MICLWFIRVIFHCRYLMCCAYILICLESYIFNTKCYMWCKHNIYILNHSAFTYNEHFDSIYFYIKYINIMAYGLLRLSSYCKTNNFFAMVLSFFKYVVFLRHCQLFFSLSGFFSSSVQTLRILLRPTLRIWWWQSRQLLLR